MVVPVVTPSLAGHRVELFGGAGNDIFRETSYGTAAYGGAGDDLFVNPGFGAFLFGGDGFDTLTFALATSSVRLEFSDHDGMERIVGTRYGDQIEAGTATGERITIEGGAGADILEGGAGHEWLYGGADRDVMDGWLGDYFLFGGDGHDDMREHDVGRRRRRPDVDGRRRPHDGWCRK